MPALIQQPAPVGTGVRLNAATPQAIYRAFNAQRKELAHQLDQLEERRGSLQRELSDGAVPAGPARAGIDGRITELDKRISDVEKQLAQADQNVSAAAGTPGAVPVEPPYQRNGPPDAVFALAGLFIVVVMLPISFSIARRIWRRSGSSPTVTSFPAELTERLNRLDQSVDSIAIEVERIGEGQRFVTRVLSDNGRALGAGAALPIEVPARDKARERGSM